MNTEKTVQGKSQTEQPAATETLHASTLALTLCEC